MGMRPSSGGLARAGGRWVIEESREFDIEEPGDRVENVELDPTLAAEHERQPRLGLADVVGEVEVAGPVRREELREVGTKAVERVGGHWLAARRNHTANTALRSKKKDRPVFGPKTPIRGAEGLTVLFSWR